MDLKKATILAISATIYTILLKAAHFIFPGLFRFSLVIKTTNILMLGAIFALLLFLIYFYKDYVKPDQKNLKVVTLVALLWQSIFLLLRLKILLLLFPKSGVSFYSVFPSLYKFLTSPSIKNYSFTASWIGSIIFLTFFIIYFNELKNSPQTRLFKATFYMIIISAISFLKSSLALFSFLFHRQDAMIKAMSDKMPLIMVPVFLVSSLVEIYFLWVFLKSRDG